MQGYYEVDSAVADEIAKGDFRAARERVYDPGATLSRKDKAELLANIKAAEEQAETQT